MDLQISIVIPIYNEGVIIQQLYTRVKNSLEKITQSFEILFIDDGSTDDSLATLLLLRQSDKRVNVISFSRNFGHQAAYTAGLKYARGKYIVTIDGDMQDPPEVIEEMYNKIVTEQLDVVNGQRKSRKEKFIKKVFIRLFHKIFSKISGYKEIGNTGNFAIYNRKALNALQELGERIKYIPGLRNYIGFKQGVVLYDRDKRKNGKTKMSFSKLFELAADAVFSSTKFPIRVCLMLGIIGVIVFFFVGIYVIIAKVAGFAIQGWPSTMLSLYFLGFIQLTFLGVLGEYVFRIYKESQNRPTYFIQEMYGEISDPTEDN